MQCDLSLHTPLNSPNVTKLSKHISSSQLPGTGSTPPRNKPLQGQNKLIYQTSPCDNFLQLPFLALRSLLCNFFSLLITLLFSATTGVSSSISDNFPLKEAKPLELA
ncbi:hypothetical protein FKM82_022545 [Ascaphus truei]